MGNYITRTKKVSSVGSSALRMDANLVTDNVAIDDAAIDNVETDNVVTDNVEIDVAEIDNAASDDVDIDDEAIRDDARSGKWIRTDDEIIIISDPALRKPINEYEPSVRDDLRREYVAKGPCRPSSHSFPRGSTSKKKLASAQNLPSNFFLPFGQNPPPPLKPIMWPPLVQA